jgi:hypothetical protein
MCPRAMEHANAEIPQQEAAVVADAAEPVCLLVTTPRVECYTRNPGVVSLASGDNLALGERPNRQQVILASGYNVFAIRRPADTDQAPIVAAEYIQDPRKR